MAASKRSFDPVAARPDGENTELPDWLIASVAEADPADPGTTDAGTADAPASPRDHVLARSARPEPQPAATLVAQSTPLVARLAPALRRFHAPRRVWARRGLVAGALVGSCAVLVSGIILTRGAPATTGPIVLTDASEAAKGRGGVVYVVDRIPGTTSPVPGSSPTEGSPAEDLSGGEVPSGTAPSGTAPAQPTAPSPEPAPSSDPAEPPVDPSEPPVDPSEPPVDPPLPTIPPLEIPDLPGLPGLGL